MSIVPLDQRQGTPGTALPDSGHVGAEPGVVLATRAMGRVAVVGEGPAAAAYAAIPPLDGIALFRATLEDVLADQDVGGVIVASLVAVRPFASTEGDPSWVVIDEAAGTFLATLGLTGIPAVVAWAVFRVADIFKRFFFGVSQAERLPGSVGVTADDLVAGLYGLAVGWLVSALLGDHRGWAVLWSPPQPNRALSGEVRSKSGADPQP